MAHWLLISGTFDVRALDNQFRHKCDVHKGLQQHQEHHVARCRARSRHRVDGSGVVAAECQRHARIPRSACGSDI